MNILLKELKDEEKNSIKSVLKQLKGIGSQQIRNIGSIGGNIMTGNTVSCLFPILSAIV